MPERPRNLAARMGRWSAAHWRTATFGWLAFVVAAMIAVLWTPKPAAAAAAAPPD